MKFFITILLCCVTYVVYRGIIYDTPLVTISYENQFKVPKNVKNLALLGCTPHPTAYIRKHGTQHLPKLKLEEFIDCNDLKDSFREVITLCKQHQIDHLLITYLPIYFVEMRMLTKEAFIKECKLFFDVIEPQIKDMLMELNVSIPITIIIPTEQALAKTPLAFVSPEERIRYSIKQFPRILMKDSQLTTITIINNKNAGQNEGIINYLVYEYLFEKKVIYTMLETTKERFHKYL